MEERQADRSDSGQSSLSSSDVNISTSQGSQELQGSQGSQAVQDFHDQKASDILDACRWRDIGRLKSLAEAEGGFLTDNLRQRACMCYPNFRRGKKRPLTYMRSS